MLAKRSRRKLSIRITVLLIALILTPNVVKAGALTDIQQLAGSGIDRSVLWSPGKLSTGADGSLYVVDSCRNHILKFSSDGNYAGDIPFTRVSTVAVAPNGDLYIGSNLEYSVSIVRNGQKIGFLGKGAGEFRSVRDVAYDPSGNKVYVVDNIGNSVRVFDANGRDLGSIAGVNLPVAIAVSDSVISIIDTPVVSEGSERRTASRLSLFDRSYGLVATVDDYNDKMFNPTAIAFSDGVLYVTDAALQTVLMFDKIGAFLGEVQAVGGAVSIAAAPDGMIYISSSDTRSIEIFETTSGPSGRQGGLQ